ncbi:NAD-dependent histone deacetylase sir2 [Ceratobasidium sp. 370]|nr:NAD-dependent histone deacetylase sir2 [Ceratobasidium sp. 370]
MSSSVIGTLNPKLATEIHPPEIEDTYQDINSDEFEEYSDLEDEEGGTPPSPALEQLMDQMNATFSEEDIDDMYTYLKEAGMTILSGAVPRALFSPPGSFCVVLGMLAWIKLYVVEKRTPIAILLLALGSQIPLNIHKEPHTDSGLLQRLLKVTLSRILRRREKLPNVNTPDDVVALIKRSKNIIVLTGAGISVSCGIPDFRSSSGIYAQINENNNYELEDPQQMFDIDYFREKPSVFYSFASQIYPSNFIPSPCHRFIKLLENRGKLLRNYTQNIDTLETEVGVKRVLQCHGSFATATCIQCKTKVNGAELKDDIFANRIPLCKVCNETVPPKPQSKSKKKDVWNPRQRDEDDDLDIPTPPLPKGIMKPDIVFFGEPLTDDFDHYLFEDRETVDLLLVIGTSLKAGSSSTAGSLIFDVILLRLLLFLSSSRMYRTRYHRYHNTHRSELRTYLSTHLGPDKQNASHARYSRRQWTPIIWPIFLTDCLRIRIKVVLLGDADRVVEYLCGQLGWTLPAITAKPGKSGKEKPDHPSGSGIKPTKAFNHEHVWMFPGAEGGNWALRDPPVAKLPTLATPLSRPNISPVFTRKYSSSEHSPAPSDRQDSDRSVKKSRLH